MQKIIIIFLIFLGESIMIYSEVFAAKNIVSFWDTFGKMSIMMAFAGIILVLGYMLGMKTLKDIWIISVVSISSIIVMEPIINYLLFTNLPSKGTLIGLILGILGILSAFLIK